jgi:integrase
MGRITAKESARARTLSDEEIRKVWITASGRSDVFSDLLRFLMTTGARRDEAARLTWDEIDGANWVLPARRHKVKTELTRPLSAQAQAILASRPRFEGCPYVFSTSGRTAISGFSYRKKEFDKACSGVTDWTLHDLRRVCRSLMARAGVRPDIAERALGHSVGSIVMQTYDRHDYRPELAHAFEALAAEIDRIVNPPPADNIHQLRGRHAR